LKTAVTRGVRVRLLVPRHNKEKSALRMPGDQESPQPHVIRIRPSVGVAATKRFIQVRKIQNRSQLNESIVLYVLCQNSFILVLKGK
ncbi:hypothetical protein, partial [Bacillus subtilis]|uniref:hypothetical protein n=1 Tax=Bacillus subtilis TaxID=1423 RepID=UPI00059CAE1E